MNRVFYLLLLFLLLGGATAFGYQAHDRTPSAILFEEAPDFREQVINDLKESFQLSLANYTEVTPQDLEELETGESEKSLIPIYWSSMNGMEKGDLMPYIFMNGNQGILLTKKADGTNTYYAFEKKEKYWEVTAVNRKQGKAIKSFTD